MVSDKGVIQAKVKRTGAVTSGTDFHPFDEKDVEESDLVQMLFIDTPNILNTLRHRHGESAVYTNVGAKDILISVNPYKWLDIYTQELMMEHYEAFGTKDLQPHVYSIAADAYKTLCVHGSSQSIITSGESGSGKTENAKQIFRFLAEIAGSQSVVAEGEISMQQLLIHSNPLLEAYGNAKTSRNNNSSRFGKLVTVHFDRSGKIVGSNTRNYLLEKTRVTSPSSGERNYHIFYQLLSGLPAPLKTKHKLGQLAEYSLLNQSESAKQVDGLDDAAEWRLTHDAMRQLGLTPEEQTQMLDLVSSH